MRAISSGVADAGADSVTDSVMGMLKRESRDLHCAAHGAVVEVGFAGRWFGCPQCSVLRVAAADRAARKIELARELGGLGMPLMYRGKQFGDWQVSGDGQVEKLVALRELSLQLAVPKSAPNLVLYGNTGTGKTLLACMVLTEAMLSVAESGQGESVRRRMYFVSAAEYLARIKDTWQRSAVQSEREVVAQYGGCDVLVLDDVGAGDKAAGDQDRLFALLDMRYVRGLPTIITTNLAREALRRHLGDRAFDRVQQRSLWAACQWVSFREFVASAVEI